ncbi:hypothetical protein DGG96_14970 [Legionella qingyii]|uniref:Rho-GAP domain-containing protein n=1 Tax=Legionella qingyii TaxID=2184757 RepID=A0A317TZ38_9GAMM|nr:RhoGAP domain-containing protein [Legionella qingyii]PWY54801.1 hypothetical protein DGG96_14970 [Legionella qingyii]RUR22525.1 hypothetical protein ELY20_09555 [Legionella qingyii]RUR27996.1 hypothetical protein ELY16_04290 [Legionella qingyii]
MPSNERLRQKKIENLQYAALILIKLIDNKLKKDVEKEGVFRISAFSEPRRKALVAEIEQGRIDFTEMTILQCAQVLKAILGTLQANNELLFTAIELGTLIKAKQNNENYLEKIKHILEQRSEINQKIAFCLLRMLNNVANDEKTKMTSDNLSRMIGPNLFPMFDNNDLSSIKIIEKQNEICSDLITNASILIKPQFYIVSTHYEAQVKNASENRFHLFNAKSHKLDGDYKKFTGDLLKSQILLNFKKQLENATAQNLEEVITKLEKSPEYKVLAASQGLTTWVLSFFVQCDTSSVKAFREMVAERRSDLEFEKTLEMK